MTICTFMPLCAAVLVLGQARARGETVALDSMDDNQAAWGAAASAETDLVREGAAALRWSPEEGPLERRDIAINLSATTLCACGSTRRSRPSRGCAWRYR